MLAHERARGGRVKQRQQHPDWRPRDDAPGDVGTKLLEVAAGYEDGWREVKLFRSAIPQRNPETFLDKPC